MKGIILAGGSGTRLYPLCNAFDCYADKYDVNDTPVALDVSLKVLTLPLYADLSLEDVDRICEIIMKE